ncbi:MAG TPA: hypothetical protein VK939_00955 [Longimicrobiales bacterium]|nr:hypothetical protein [Longimicrobiales bacterium]
MTGRSGHSLAEMIVVLPLTSLLLALLLGTLVAQLRLARTITDRLGRAETERIAYAVLRQELRWTGAADIAAAADDSVTLRLLRAVGVVCRADADGWLVAYRGWREPNPDKDSVLIVDGQGERHAPLEGSTAATAPCGDSPARRLRAGTDPSRGVVLLYERGSYHLAGGALRFRAGAEGRQPLTGEWLDDGATSLTFTAGRPVPSGVVLQLSEHPARAWRWLLPNQFPP